MGASGLTAYRHKGIYYRVLLPEGGRPDECVGGITRAIPRDPAKLEEWIEETAKTLEDKKRRDRLFPGLTGFDDYSDDEGEAVVEIEAEVEAKGEAKGENYIQVLQGSDLSWTLGITWIWYTYVIDLDNHVFTFNGAIHFKFDTLPSPWRSGKRWGLIDYLTADKRVKQKYDQFEVLITAPPEWGVPTWDTLTVSQHLATSLVKSLVQNFTDELALTHFPSVWHKIGFFCWQVANTAATSHLFCPPFDATPKADSFYVRADLVREAWSTSPKIQKHMGGKGTIRQYCWFRGCLITFCPKLDEPAYMMRRVGQMVDNLRKHDRTSGVGIIMSGWHIIAVAVDGPEVRHSPVMDLHDGNELKDGVLLLMHLLSPTSTTPKTPWRKDLTTCAPNATSSLTEDVLQQIIHFTDWDTYLVLPSVSRHFRSICLIYPRVGHSILLGHETNANSESLFRVRSTGSTSSTLARLGCLATIVDNRLPVWRYSSKTYQYCILQPGLVGTFQFVQSGTGPFEGAPVKRDDRPTCKRVFFRDVIKGDKHPEMRIQALDGLWQMVPVTVEWNPKTKYSRWYPINGITISEILTGHDREDMEELSDGVEG